MSRLDSRQKNAPYQHPYVVRLSQAITDALSDTVKVTDASILPLLKDLTPEEMRVALIVHKWKPLYGAFLKARIDLGSKRNRDPQVTVLRKANKILRGLIPWLSGSRKFSGEFISSISAGELEGAADYIAEWPSHRRKHDEYILACCAEDLAKMFLARGRKKPPWREIGTIIATEIPEAGRLRRGDLGHWIYNIVKRHRDREVKLKQQRVRTVRYQSYLFSEFGPASPKEVRKWRLEQQKRTRAGKNSDSAATQ